jgi:hypothetical protein
VSLHEQGVVVKFLGPRFIIAMTVVICATGLYAVGVVAKTPSTPVEPQSVFTLYGAVLGYLFGSHDRTVGIGDGNGGQKEKSLV